MYVKSMIHKSTILAMKNQVSKIWSELQTLTACMTLYKSCDQASAHNTTINIAINPIFIRLFIYELTKTSTRSNKW